MLRRKREPADPDAGRPRRVLLVNDDDGASELEARLLRAQGYEVRRAANADDATAEVGVVRPHCVVLDLGEGGIGGSLKVLDGIRANHDPGVANARVVLVASHGRNRMFSWQAGVDGFVSKPFHADELLVEVADVLARPDEERARHRHLQLQVAKSQGRTLDVKPWETRRF